MNARYRRLMLLASLAALPAMGLVIAFMQWPEHGLVLKSGSYLGIDFLNYWLGGRLALTGRVAEIYDLDAYNRVAWQMFDPAMQKHNFSYPPHILPLLAPFGALPYFAGLAVWNLVGLAVFLVAVLGRLPGRSDGALAGLVLLSPILLVNWVYGQIGLMLAGLFVGALQLLPRRPLAAGILIGMLTVKPQLGLFLPLLLVVERQWRAFAAAALTATAMMALSVALFGIEPWQHYVREVLPLQESFIYGMRGRQYGLMVPSVYGGLVHVGLSTGAALAVHAVAAAVVAGLTVRAMLAPVDWPLKAALVATASLMMSPYVLAYDLAVPCAALLWYLTASGKAPDRFGGTAVALAWSMPFGIVMLASLLHLPLGPVALLGLFGWLLVAALGWRNTGEACAASTAATA